MNSNKNRPSFENFLDIWQVVRMGKILFVTPEYDTNSIFTFKEINSL